MSSKSNKNKDKMVQKKNIRKLIIRGLIIFSVIAFFALGAFGVYAYSVIKKAPDVDSDEILDLSQTSVVLDDEEEFMDIVPSSNKRVYIDIEEMPDYLVDAYISIEDERFEAHNGIDIKRIAGAAYSSFLALIKNEGGIQGGSTITQQLIKNTVLTNEVKLSRKITEIHLALNLEKELSKIEILEAYLNTIPLGGTTYGVEAGARYYFNKGISEVSLIEAAYLAGVTQSPTGYNAFIDKNIQNPEGYLNRTKTVLSKMQELNKITKEEYEDAVQAVDSGALIQSFSRDSNNSLASVDKLNYEWFTRPVIEQVIEGLMEDYGYSREEAESILSSGGLKIYSTMNRELQLHSQQVLDNDSELNAISEMDGSSISEPQASAVIMDYRTGEVKAMVGGRGEQPSLTYNRAYDTDHFSRATGSALKPLTVYAPAIDSKFATAAEIYKDAPLTGELLKEYGELKNADKKYSGDITMREAVKRSVNVYSVKLVYDMGREVSARYAEAFGINMGDESANLSSLALGEFRGTTPYKMAAAYGVFGNNGLYKEPILFTKVVDKSGQVLLEGKSEERQVLTPEAAYITYDLLKEPLTYTATKVDLGAMPAAGKTGTSSQNMNYWFVGLTPHYAGAVWVGTDDSKEIKNFNSNNTSALWSQIMTKANEGLPTEDIEKPQGVITVRISTRTGLLASWREQNSASSIMELFIKGTEPKKQSPVQKEQEPKEDSKDEEKNVPEEKPKEDKPKEEKPTEERPKEEKPEKPEKPENPQKPEEETPGEEEDSESEEEEDSPAEKPENGEPDGDNEGNIP
ncbi:MAG: transglycosylase domain-containing protein [Clostridiaceae bacterium]